MLQKGLIHKAIKNIPETFEAMEKLVSPFYNEGVFLILDDALSQTLTLAQILLRQFDLSFQPACTESN